MTSKTGISDKAQLATDHYIANVIINPVEGYSWTQAMRDAGYAASTTDKQGLRVWGIVGVQEQIEAARAEIRAKSEDIAAEVARMYREGYAVADKQKNSTGMATNTTGLARLNGLLTDNINNTNIDQPLDLDQDQLSQARAEVKALQLVKDRPQEAKTA